MPTFDASTNGEQVPFCDVLIELCDLVAEREVEIMLVGATARDIAIAMEGVQPQPALRATNDVDIAVAVPDEASYEQLVGELSRAQGGSAHKFVVGGVTVDVVPFGGIEREDRTVTWPDGSVMNTIGFAEALPSTIDLLLPGGRTMRVASIAAQAAFKVFAWADRGHWTDRDAVDLKVLLGVYSDGVRLDRVYADASLSVLERFDYDVRLAGAHWVGADVRGDLGRRVAARCGDIVVASRDDGRMVTAMRGDATRDDALLAAFIAGLRSTES